MTTDCAIEPSSKTFHESMSSDVYIRERLQPRLRDIDYLHLKDLLAFITLMASKIKGDVFDYGCGCAPYRRFFSHCKSYIGADIAASQEVDRILKDDGMTQEANESYDTVLSTQVLEHIKEPELYLRECHRLLRPRGELILTTHGLFEEHGCPYDFQRWTCRGLEVLVEQSGFEVIESGKLTTEIRALVQLFNQMILHLRCAGHPFIHIPLAVLRKVYGRLLRPLLNWFADQFSHQGMVDGSSRSSLYVCVFVRARKK
jgi:SAM-dependent methyltransferase